MRKLVGKKKGWFRKQATGGGFDADAQAFIDATGITDPTQQGAINDLVVGLKADGLWSKMKAIYPFVGGTADTHKYNLKDPRDLDVAFRLGFSGIVNHSNTGVIAPTTGYIVTYLTPNTHLSLRDTHLSFYSRTDTASAIKCDIGCSTTGENPIMTLYLKRPTNLVITDQYSYSSNRISASSSDSRGLFTSSRIGINDFRAYKNGSQIGSTNTINEVNGSMPNKQLHILAYNASQHSDRECAFASIGDGLTVADNANLYTRVQAYQTELSRQV